MSTHYKCDRCGQDIRSTGASAVEEVEIRNWKSDATTDRRVVRVKAKLDVPSYDHDEPDMCKACVGEAIMLAGAAMVGQAHAEDAK